MLNLMQKLHAAIVAEKAPEGKIFGSEFDKIKILKEWSQSGGHLLQVSNNRETVFLLTDDDSEFANDLGLTVNEIKPSDFDKYPYDRHPQATFWIDEKEWVLK